MMLNSQYYSTVRADILANSDMNTIPLGGDGDFAIAALYNAQATPAFSVWRTDASVKAIADAIDWSKYTPTDAADNTVTFSNRLLLIQTKQMNLQTMLTGRDYLDCSLANIRAGLRDAVIQLPSGAGGALVTSGGASGATVLNVCARNATRIEKLLAAATQTTGTVTASILTHQGAVTPDDIARVRAV